MRVHGAKYPVLVLAAILFLASFPAQASAEVKSTFLYSLANFHGKVPYSDVRVRVDRARDEVYVVERGIIRVFNKTGMEFYLFGDNPELESIYDLAVDEKGGFPAVIVQLYPPRRPEIFPHPLQLPGRCEGETDSDGAGLSIFSRFFPNYMFYRDGKFLFLGSSSMQVVVTDRNGVFQNGYNLADILEIPEKDRPDTEIFGFSLDAEGNMLFTVPVLFKAYVVTPEENWRGLREGRLRTRAVRNRQRHRQGRPGELPRGGAPSQAVVMVFDKDFRFVQEFGYRGDKPANLIRPNELAIGNAGKIYVTQFEEPGSIGF